jgi:hypothetical protein
MADTSGLPPEGWYPDRPNATRLRHWTGTGWTNEFRPLEVSPATPVAQRPVREITDPARSRRELRSQGGSLVQGEADVRTSAVPIIPVQGAAPVAPAAPAPIAVAAPTPISVTAPARPAPVAPAVPTAVPVPTAAPVASPVPVSTFAPPTVRTPAAAPAPVAVPPIIPPVVPPPIIPPVVVAEPAPEPPATSYPPIRPQTWQESFADKTPKPTGTSQTLAGWLYATSPLWLGALVIVGMTLLTIVNPLLVQAGLAAIGFLLTVLLARQDVRSLRERGYRAPSAWWVLVPFFYFLIRMIRVGARGLGMFLVYLLSTAALAGLLYVAFIGSPALLSTLVPATPAETSAIPTPLATLSAQERANLLTPDGIEAQLRVDLAKTFDVGTVDCVPFSSTDAGTTTTCVVVLDGVSYNAGLEVTPSEPDAAFVVTGMLPVQGS